jgi:hypothetical protein
MMGDIHDLHLAIDLVAGALPPRIRVVAAEQISRQ